MLTLDSVYLLTDSNTSLKSRTRNKAVLEVAFNTCFRSKGDLQVEAQPKLFSKLLKWVREVPWAAWAVTEQNYPTAGGETRRGSRALHQRPWWSSCSLLFSNTPQGSIPRTQLGICCIWPHKLLQWLQGSAQFWDMSELSSVPSTTSASTFQWCKRSFTLDNTARSSWSSILEEHWSPIDGVSWRSQSHVSRALKVSH